MDHANERNRLQAALESRGIQATTQRMRIAELLFARDQHLTALTAEMVTFLNQFLRQDRVPGLPTPLPPVTPEFGLVAQGVALLLSVFRRIREAIARYEARRSIDAYLMPISREAGIGSAARLAAQETESYRPLHRTRRELGGILDLLFGRGDGRDFVNYSRY